MRLINNKFLVPVLSLAVFLIAIAALLWEYKPALRQSIFGEATGASGEIEHQPPEEIRVGGPFKVAVAVNTHNRNVNAVGYYVHFDPNVLQVLSLDTKASFCQFYPEKKYDNINGLISLACGSPHPGFKGENTIMVIEFMPKNVGLTTLRVDPKTQLLLSDGKGTNILGEFPATDLRITAGLE